MSIPDSADFVLVASNHTHRLMNTPFFCQQKQLMNTRFLYKQTWVMNTRFFFPLHLCNQHLVFNKLLHDLFPTWKYSRSDILMYIHVFYSLIRHPVFQFTTWILVPVVLWAWNTRCRSYMKVTNIYVIIHFCLVWLRKSLIYCNEHTMTHKT